MLELENISFKYGQKEVLKNISFDVRRGELVALVGANGSGKSTLLKNIAGILRDRGRCTFEGAPMKDDYVSYLSQNSACDALLTVFEIVLLGLISKLGFKVSDSDVRKVQETLEQVGISHLANSYISELSGGQQQLAFIAQTLIRERDILLLDEPISALDISHQFDLMHLLHEETKRKGLCTITVLHHLDMAAKFADKIVVLKGGDIYSQGSPLDVFTVDMVRDIYQIESTIFLDDEGIPHVIPLKSSK